MSAREIPVFFNANGETLFGLLTEPREGHGDTVVIHLRGGNQGPSSGRNQTSARMCQLIASAGVHAFRFDYRGVGESTGAIERFRLSEPFVDDLLGAVDYLKSMGFEHFGLVGACFGASTALAAAGSISSLRGVVLLAPPVRDMEKTAAGTRSTQIVRDQHLWRYAMRALNPSVLRSLTEERARRRYTRLASRTLRARHLRPAQRMSSDLLAQIQGLIEREVPMLFVRGTKDPGFARFDRAFAGPLGHLLQRAPYPPEIEVFEGRVGAFADASIQDAVIQTVQSWLAAHLVSSSLDIEGEN